MKLKTLKDWEDKFRDLEKFMNTNLVEKLFADKGIEFKLSPVDDVNVPIKELRQEAIKWIKADIKKALKDCNEDINQRNVEWIIDTNSDKIKIWMDRFNLTKEDILKI